MKPAFNDTLVMQKFPDFSPADLTGLRVRILLILRRIVLMTKDTGVPHLREYFYPR